MFIDIRLTWKVEQLLLKHARNNFFCTFRLPLLCEIYNRKFKKFREIAGFILNPLRFHKKTEIRFWEAENLLKPEPERIEAFRNTVH